MLGRGCAAMLYRFGGRVIRRS